MTIKLKLAMVVGWLLMFSVPSFAQTPEIRSSNSTPQAQEQPNNGPSNTVAGEIALLRKSLQTLNARLREISEKLLVSDPKQGDSMKSQQNRISISSTMGMKNEK